ncbi:hypothetical protein JXA70_05085 [candidate division KSB1 bacterium]|nr:hypothetical protein [candidate division KSB1 bacterium]
MRKTISFSMISLLFIFIAALYAQQTFDVDKVEGDKKIIKIRKGGDMLHYDLLDLTDAQKKEFKKLDLACEKEIVSTKNQLDVARLELEVELDEENPDMKSINSLIDKIHSMEAEIEKKRIATEFKKRDLLTEEQKKNWSMRGLRGKKDMIMFRGDELDDLMWFRGGKSQESLAPKIKREIEIHEE